MGIVEFLRARLDDDEREARRAVEMRLNTPLRDPRRNTEPDYELTAWEDVGVPAMLIGPERVLREVEAKRRIADDYRVPTLDDCQTDWDTPPPLWTLQALASVYADHPDYDPAWADD